MPRVVAVLLVLVAALCTPALAGAADAPRPSLAVDGFRLTDSSSGTPRTIQLRGVDRSGTEYACSSVSYGGSTKRGYAIFDGPAYDSLQDRTQPDASIQAMQRWGVNAVRIPLSDACWTGDEALNPMFSGTAYQTAVLDYVDQLGRHGITAILSLHVASTSAAPNLGLRLLPMPDAVRGPAFWADVVQRLGSALPTDGGQQVPRRNVVLDLFNEPHLEDLPEPARWACWRDGCSGVDQADPPGTPAPDPTPAYDTAGMADLVAAIRLKEQHTGQAPRPLMLGGIDYANDLSQWREHLPADAADALVASFHVYRGTPTRAGTLCSAIECWDRTVGAISKDRPVVTGEVGQYDCAGDFVQDYASWADGRGVSYLAWTWNAMRRGDASGNPATSATGWRCDLGPTVLKYNDGTPTDAYGVVVCRHLRARHAATTGAAPALLPAGSPDPCPGGPAPTGPPADAGPAVVADPPAAVPVVASPFSAPVVQPAPAAVPAPVLPRPAAQASRTATVSSRTLRLKGGRVALSISCGRGTPPCRGRLQVRTAAKVAVGRRRAVVVLLSTSYALKAGAAAKLSVAPTKDGRALLRRTRKVAVVATATSDGGGPRARRLTLAR